MNLKSSATLQLSPILLTLILGGLQTVMPMSTDLYLPALPTIARDLSASPGTVQFTLAVFMIGVAIGQVVYGPITDKYGRKKPLIFGLVVYILGALICALAPSINILIGGRFVQALGGSASAVITPAIARDLWSGKTLADRLSLLFLVVGVAPILAPSLGGLILMQWNWHGLFWVLVTFALLVATTVTLLPETSSSHERAQNRLRDAIKAYTALLHNLPFMLYVLTGACAVGMLLAYITGSPFMYIDALGVTPELFAVLFGVNAVGFVSATQLNRLLLRQLSLDRIAQGAVAAALLLALLLLIVVASGYESTLTMTVLFFAFSAAIGCTFPNIAALALGTVETRMGSASALQGTMHAVFGGIAGGLVGALSNGTTLPMMGVIMGFAILAAVFMIAAHWKQSES